MTYPRYIDYLRVKKNYNVTNLRRVSTAIAFVGSVAFLFPVGFISKSYIWLVITCVSISVGFVGCNISGVFTASIEIAPQYSSLIMGINNTVASCMGFITTLICGEFIQKYVNNFDKTHVYFRMLQLHGNMLS